MTTIKIISTPQLLEEFIDNDHWGYTEFQLDYIIKLMCESSFEYFVTDGHIILLDDIPKLPGPRIIMWHSKGKLHSVRLGEHNQLTDIFIGPKKDE